MRSGAGITRVRWAKRVGAVAVALVAVSMLAGCGRGSEPVPHSPGAMVPPPATADDAGSTKQGIAKVVEANNTFGLDLYGELSSADENGNLFFSPYSMSVALAMVTEGAEGTTEEEMRATLHLPAAEIMRPNTAALHNRLNAEGKPFELATGNALWVQRDYPLVPEFVDAVQRYYSGMATELDFAGDAEGARITINDYIAEQTHDRIEDLLPEGSLDDLTRLVLTNAIYFKGDWKQQFDPKETRDEEFFVTPDAPVKVPMMTMEPEESISYGSLDGTEVVDLPYKGDELSMVVLLPSEGEMAAFEQSLSADGVSPYLDALEPTSHFGAVSLPKFELNTEYEMKETLIALGMPTAFGDKADFTGMNVDGGLSVSEVFHKAFIKVDEEGTEAAAATGGVAEFVSMPPSFRADRPFVFLIRDVETGAILFLGRVTDPTKG